MTQIGERLQGKRAIITGAASGIGRASALLFAREGAKVLVADWAEDGARETASMIEKAGGAALAQMVDAGDEASYVNGQAIAVDGGLCPHRIHLRHAGGANEGHNS